MIDKTMGRHLGVWPAALALLVLQGLGGCASMSGAGGRLANGLANLVGIERGGTVMTRDGEIPYRDRWLPYVEADIEASRMEQDPVWISNDELLFNDVGGTFVESQDGPVTVIHWDLFKRVVSFDLKSRAVAFYRAGELLHNYRNPEQVRILRKQRDRNHKWAGPPEALEKVAPSNDYWLGPPRQEAAVTIQTRGHPRPTCPPSDLPRKQRREHFLSNEHGCLVGHQYDERPGGGVEHWVLYRSDGQRIPLAIRPDDRILEPRWVPWLGAYQLVGSFSSYSPDVDSHANEYLLRPDGRLLRVPLNWGFNGMAMTRAGAIGKRLFGPSGLYLWHRSELLRVADGRIETEPAVSPDGCQVAYVDTKFHPFLLPVQSPPRNRVRVIDVCKDLNVPRDHNPFVWPDPPPAAQ